MSSANNSTEDGKIALRNQSPFGDVLCGIGRALIDLPSDVLRASGTIAQTKREQSHLRRRIDQLKFPIGDTESGNDTSRTMN